MGISLSVHIIYLFKCYDARGYEIACLSLSGFSCVMLTSKVFKEDTKIRNIFLKNPTKQTQTKNPQLLRDKA